MKLKSKSKGFAWWLLLLAALLVLGPPAWMVIIRCEGVPPLVELETPFTYIGLRRDASVAVADAGRGLRSLRIALHQGD